MKNKQTEKPMLTCIHCEKQFKYKSEKDRHELSHMRQFTCDICQKKFSFLSALRRHQKQHKRTGSVRCDKCDRSFRDEILLQRHKKYAHTGSFLCSICSVKFSSQVALQSHMKTHKPLSERKYKCSHENCGKAFNFLHHLTHHELTHTNMKQHFCNVCGKGFIQSQHLKRHLLSHEAGWLYCTEMECKKKFPNELERQNHIAACHEQNANVELVNAETVAINQIKDELERDEILCTYCGQLVLKQDLTTHQNTCLSEDNIEDSFEILKKEDFDIYNIEHYPTEVTLPNATENEMNGNIDLYKTITSLDSNNETFNTDNTKAKDDISNTFMTLGIKDNNNLQSNCNGCKCSSKCDKSNMPQIEYRNGAVKLKETFDFDIQSVIVDVKPKDYKFIPFNSCKAVLGNCIVTGNDVIDEGCLCAKMIVDEQQVTAQEMEEIMPVGMI